jgi:asparagine synthase (glutamine-hydrolysing)
MCGIAGFLDTARQTSPEQLRTDVNRMASTMVHRGPDDSGDWCDAAGGIALGFRRLSIIDLSPAGHQPMESASGRHVIIFNGEVYNAEALRGDLQAQGRAPAFRGHSDTEVMLAAVEAWGLEEAVKRFLGMFAFALWDRQERRLHLVRDRIGVKPLYYGWAGPILLFGSELKSLRAHPAFRAEVDRNALSLYLRHNYVPAPHSIYQGIFKLPPGTLLTIDPVAPTAAMPKPYWSARQVAEAGRDNPFTGTATEAVDQLDTLLRDAVKLRMVADVPLGVFLSGGIDSSLVTALMQVQCPRPVRTFSIGFNEDAYNEARFAREVAKHLGTDHTELYVTPAEAQAVIPRLPSLYDEPFADSSQIPTYLVSALARRQVTVSLSGDGGDELFGGYTRYFQGRRIWNSLRWLGGGVRRGLARSLRLLSARSWDSIARTVGLVVPRVRKQRQVGYQVSRLSEVLQAESPDVMYWLLVSHWKSPASVVRGGFEPLTTLTDRNRWAALPEFTQRMMYLDQMTYLPDDILVKVDRASMGISLEAREPLLDHRLIEFAWRLPVDLKIRGGKGKWPLRQVLYRYVPPALVERPKTGFGIPLDSWLRGPLRDWAEALLDEQRLRREGFFEPAPIRQQWAEHLAGVQNWHYHLWDVLMFQAWHEQYSSTAAA